MCHQQKIKPETPFKGSLNVRLGPELHRRVAIAAAQKHLSVNKLIADTLDQAID
jgi:predicted HicB family RNase H-like nuclease